MKGFALTIFFILHTTAASSACLSGYSPYGTGCRADLPSTEFFYGSLDSSIPADYYPVCGAGRVPLTGDGSYSWSTLATSGVPRSSVTRPDLSDHYNYLRSASPPVYGYQGLNRCVCIGHTIAETPQVASSTFLPALNGSPRVLPDVSDVIRSQDTAAQARYGMVAIATDNNSDGRLGSLYTQAKSKCACPNLNEVPEPLDSSVTPDERSGVRCVPAFNSPNRVLTTFIPSQHDGTQSLIMNRTADVVDTGGVNLVTSVRLPKSLNNQGVTDLYNRKIWLCANPYRLNPTTGACEFLPDRHACDEGNESAGIPASEVEPRIAGVSKPDAFKNAVNKKLSGCLNEFGSIGSTVKFDCIENAGSSYSSFDDLWSSSDDIADGGQTNALTLTDAGGRILTGFYRLDGQRCAEYSEFVDDIYRGRLKKSGTGWTFNPLGSSIPRPSLTNSGYNLLVQQLVTAGKRIPQTPLEKSQCPLLVRTALMAQCPKNPPLPIAQKTIEVRDSNGVLLKRRCSVASNILVHARIEQVFEIEERPVLKTVDTFMDANQINAISVSQITARKYGSNCPPGTTGQGGVCVY